MNLETLSELGEKHGADKETNHHYCGFYHELLSPIRHSPITLLEIGVLGGNSLRMWDEFFTHPDRRIIGMDIHDREVKPTGKIEIIIGDATNPNLIYEFGEFPIFDVIVDDGGHFSIQQKDSLRLLWPHLKSGGIYICEDCHTSYFYPWTKPDEQSFVSSMSDWIDRCMELGAGHCGVPTETDIEEIVFRKSLVVIKKR